MTDDRPDCCLVFHQLVDPSEAVYLFLEYHSQWVNARATRVAAYFDVDKPRGAAEEQEGAAEIKLVMGLSSSEDTDMMNLLEQEATDMRGQIDAEVRKLNEYIAPFQTDWSGMLGGLRSSVCGLSG